MTYLANSRVQNVNGETPLFRAVEICATNRGDDRFAFVELLLMYGADVNVQRVNPMKSRVIGDTPLHVAVRNNKIEIVKMILNHNPDFQVLNIDKQTPLILSKQRFCSNEVKVCIEEHMHKIRCQMYTFYRDHMLESLDYIKPISPDKKRKRK